MKKTIVLALLITPIVITALLAYNIFALNQAVKDGFSSDLGVFTSDTSGTDPNACSYTYSAWGTCTNSQQTRTITAVSPASCTGTPILTQTCISTITCTSFTYSDYNCNCINGQQTRTMLQAFPAGCTGGTPTTTRTCQAPVTTPISCGSLDTNANAILDVSDLSSFMNIYGAYCSDTPAETLCGARDTNNDCKLDITDLSNVNSRYNLAGCGL